MDVASGGSAGEWLDSMVSEGFSKVTKLCLCRCSSPRHRGRGAERVGAAGAGAGAAVPRQRRAPAPPRLAPGRAALAGEAGPEHLRRREPAEGKRGRQGVLVLLPGELHLRGGGTALGQQGTVCEEGGMSETPLSGYGACWIHALLLIFREAYVKIKLKPEPLLSLCIS